MKNIQIILVLLAAQMSFGQEKNDFRVKGFIDTYHAVRIEKPNDFLASRSRFRGELDKINGRSYFFASINAVYNNVVPELSKIQFREAYMEYTADNWSFKAGRQIIIWGKADGMKITDVISPMDLTEFLAQEYDDIRMPVNGIVISKFSDSWNLDLLCVPVFESYLLPGEGNPWEIDYSGFGNGIVQDNAKTPEFNLSNMEYGGKLSFYLSGIDIDLSALNTWNKAPVYSYFVDDSLSVLHIRPEHQRMGFIGLGFSKSLSAFIIRGEGAFNINKKFSPSFNFQTANTCESNSLNYLIGIDWYPGNEWTLTGQFADEYIIDYVENMEVSEHTLLSTVGLSKKILHSTLSLSAFAYIGLNEGDFFNRTSADYALSDNIHVMAGLDWFHGSSGLFGQYNKNTQVWLKAKFSF